MTKDNLHSILMAINVTHFPVPYSPPLFITFWALIGQVILGQKPLSCAADVLYLGLEVTG